MTDYTNKAMANTLSGTTTTKWERKVGEWSDPGQLWLCGCGRPGWRVGRVAADPSCDLCGYLRPPMAQEEAPPSNCWTCRWDADEGDLGHDCTRELWPDGTGKWVCRNIGPDGMPPRDATGCPGYERERGDTTDDGWSDAPLPRVRGPISHRWTLHPADPRPSTTAIRFTPALMKRLEAIVVPGDRNIAEWLVSEAEEAASERERAEEYAADLNALEGHPQEVAVTLQCLRRELAHEREQHAATRASLVSALEDIGISPAEDADLADVIREGVGDLRAQLAAAEDERDGWRSDAEIYRAYLNDIAHAVMDHAKTWPVIVEEVRGTMEANADLRREREAVAALVARTAWRVPGLMPDDVRALCLAADRGPDALAALAEEG